MQRIREMDTIYIFIFKFSFILGEKIVANFAVKSVRDLTCKAFLRGFGIITFKIFEHNLSKLVAQALVTPNSLQQLPD